MRMVAACCWILVPRASISPLRIILATGVRELPGLKPDCVWQADTESMQIRFVHRRTAAHEVYNLLNEYTEPGNVSCIFRDTGKGVPARWDPATGDIELLSTDVRLNPDGRVTVKVFLGAHDACFIVFDR